MPNPNCNNCQTCAPCEPAVVGLSELEKVQVCNLIAEKTGDNGGVTGSGGGVGTITESNGIFTWTGPLGELLMWSSGAGSLTPEDVKATVVSCLADLGLEAGECIDLGTGGITNEDIKSIVVSCLADLGLAEGECIDLGDGGVTGSGGGVGTITENNGVFTWSGPLGEVLMWSNGGDCVCDVEFSTDGASIIPVVDGVSQTPIPLPVGPAGTNGTDGTNGVSVSGVSTDENNDIVFELSNGSTLDPLPLDALLRIEYADAVGLPWDENNPNWIDPASIAKWCELRLDNGATGCEVWRRLEDTNGVPQWHQGY